jgi:hypothetical protein
MRCIPFETEGNFIDDPSVDGDENASGLLIPKRGRKEAKSASDIHWVL